jgi:hypothetical protein
MTWLFQRTSAFRDILVSQMWVFDENSLVPLTLSFQHVQFIKGGARTPF